MQNQSGSSMMHQAAERFSRQYFLRVCQLYFFSLVTGFNFFGGFFVLILRQMRFYDPGFMVIGVAGLPLCILISIVLAGRCRLSQEKAIAVIDSYNRAGGLSIASFETGDSSWNDHLPGSPEIPVVRANLNRRLPVLLLSFAFLLAAGLVPLYSFNRDEDRVMDLKGLEREAKMQIEALEETAVLPVEEATQLEETLENIISSADSHDPAKTFEALDQLNDKLQKEGAKAAQNAACSLDELERLKEQARQLQQTDPSRQNELKARQNQLEKSFSTSQTAGEMSGKTKNSIKKGLEAVNPDGSPSAEQIRQAARELEKYIEQKAQEKRQMLQKLRKAQVIDQKTFEKLKKEGKIKPVTDFNQLNPDDTIIVAPDQSGNVEQMPGDGSANNPATQGQQGDGQSGQSQSQQGEGQNSSVEGQSGQSGQTGSSMQPGTGEASRGGGSTPVLFNRKSSEHNIRYKDENLPQPGRQSLDDSVAIGIGISAPTVEQNNPAENGPAAQKPGSSSAKTEVILPRHRNVVKNFFERQK